jgi:hypothetical protein
MLGGLVRCNIFLEGWAVWQGHDILEAQANLDEATHWSDQISNHVAPDMRNPNEPRELAQ